MRIKSAMIIISCAILGLLFFALAIVQWSEIGYISRYSDVVNQARRVGSGFIEPPERTKLASRLTKLAFWSTGGQDEAILNAYDALAAQNYPVAAGILNAVLEEENDPRRRALCYFLLGRIHIVFEDPKATDHLLKLALRNDPDDVYSKFLIEHLYSFVFKKKKGRPGEATLEQAPGVGDGSGDADGEGQGRGSGSGGI